MWGILTHFRPGLTYEVCKVKGLMMSIRPAAGAAVCRFAGVSWICRGVRYSVSAPSCRSGDLEDGMLLWGRPPENLRCASEWQWIKGVVLSHTVLQRFIIICFLSKLTKQLKLAIEVFFPQLAPKLPGHWRSSVYFQHAQGKNVRTTRSKGHISKRLVWGSAFLTSAQPVGGCSAAADDKCTAAERQPNILSTSLVASRDSSVSSVCVICLSAGRRSGLHHVGWLPGRGQTAWSAGNDPGWSTSARQGVAWKHTRYSHQAPINTLNVCFHLPAGHTMPIVYGA